MEKPLKGTLDHDKRQEPAISGCRLHWTLTFLHLIFPFSPGSICNLVSKSPQNMEKTARFLGVENLQNPVTSLAVMFFFGVPNHRNHYGCGGIAVESCCRDSKHWRSFTVTSAPKAQKLVLGTSFFFAG